MKNILVLLFCVFFTQIYAQKTLKINAIDETKGFKKTLLLVPAVSGDYYDNFVMDSAELKGNSYSFTIPKSTSNIPKPFSLSMEVEKNKSYNSTDVFFLPTDTNTVYFNSETQKVKQNKNEEIVKQSKMLSLFLQPLENENNKLEKIKSLSYKKNGYSELLMKTIDSLAPDYKKISIKEDSLLLIFSKKNPDNLAIFWRVIKKISDRQYNLIFSDIYNNFSAKIQNSKYGKILNQDLINLSTLQEGKDFPKMLFDNKAISEVYGKKYTLIDFWFSYCPPCLEQMPKYKKLYSNYKEKGFEIIGISTDREKDIPNWKRAIKKYGLDWQNVLDKDKKEYTRYNINSSPTTFLLDSEGKIIKKNISPEELEIFLGANLN